MKTAWVGGGLSTVFFTVTIYSVKSVVVFFIKKQTGENKTKWFVNINQCSQIIMFK